MERNVVKGCVGDILKEDVTGPAQPGRTWVAVSAKFKRPRSCRLISTFTGAPPKAIVLHEMIALRKPIL